MGMILHVLEKTERNGLSSGYDGQTGIFFLGWTTQKTFKILSDIAENMIRITMLIIILHPLLVKHSILPSAMKRCMEAVPRGIIPVLAIPP